MKNFEEDCIRSLDTIYISSRASQAYHDEIIHFCNSRNIKYIILEDTIWPRNGALRISSSRDPETKGTLVSYKGSDKFRFQFEQDPRSLVYQASSKSFAVGGLSTPYGVSEGINIEGLSFSGKIALNAGEVFNVVNKHGKRKVIISEKSLIRFLASSNIANNPNNVSWFKKYYDCLKISVRYGKTPSPNYVNLRSIAKYTLAKYLLCDKSDLIIIPTYSYDIDMSFIYLGNGKMFAHSYLETLNFYLNNKAKLDELLITNPVYFENLLKDKLSFIDNVFLKEVERKFIKHGLEVIKGCGYIEDFSRGSSVENAGLSIGHSGFCGNANSSFLMNGLPFYNDDGSTTYLSLNSSLQCHKDYFKNLLSKHNVNVNFSNAKFEYKIKGGFRCATITNLEDISPGLRKVHAPTLVTAPCNQPSNTGGINQNISPVPQFRSIPTIND